MAGVNPPASAPAAAVPALSEWSLLALVPLVGVPAFRATMTPDRLRHKHRKVSDEPDHLACAGAAHRAHSTNLREQNDAYP